MRITIICASLLLLFASCNKDNDPTSNNSTNEGATAIPRKIVLSFYDQGKLSKKWIYEPDSTSAPAKGICYWTDSSYYITPGPSTYFKVRQSFEYDADAGMFSSISSRNYSSGQIDHWVNDMIEPRENTVNNYKVTNIRGVNSASGIQSRLFNITQYNDSLQQKSFNSVDCRVGQVLFNDTKQFQVILGYSSGFNIWNFNKDSIYLDDYPNMLTTSNRYFNYYADVLPWYTPKTKNLSVFHIRSPYVCDSFILRNGEYVPQSSQSAYVFRSSLERKVMYTYSSDTTAIKSFIDLINPIARDPMWFFISANAHAFTTFGNVREEGNYTDLYNWMAQKSVDSVFLMNNGQRMFKQVSITTNTVEKDEKGRIKKITNKLNSSTAYKTIELSY